MSESSLSIIATFIVYIAMMLYVGYWAYKRTSNASDYFLGGRSLGPWPTALSAGASDMSGWLLLGLPGYAFGSGYEALWLAAGLLMGTWANWWIIAKRFRMYTVVVNDALTLPAYFSNRFNDNTRVLQVICAFFILLFFLFYTSSGLVAGGKLFATVFGINYSLAVTIGTVCIISYTLFGGFLAVSWTDLIQGLLMAAALLIVPIIALQLDGGLSNVLTNMEALNPELINMWTNNQGESLSVIAIVSLLAWGLGYFGQPHILARFAAISDKEHIPTARRIAVSWTAISMAGALLVGFSGMIYVQNNMPGGLADAETIFMVLVNSLFHPVIAGILLAAILAAIMSTADSQLLVSSSALAEDCYKTLLNKEASPETVLNVGRLGVVIIALVALSLAFNENSSVLGLVSYAWAGFGAAFGPALILSLYWSRMNKRGALTGILVGGVTIVVWKQLSGGIFDVYEIVPGMILSTIGIIAVSLLTDEPEPEVMQQFKAMKESL